MEGEGSDQTDRLLYEECLWQSEWDFLEGDPNQEIHSWKYQAFSGKVFLYKASIVNQIQNKESWNWKMVLNLFRKIK